MQEIKIKVTQGNLKNGHFYIPRDCDLFPKSIWGGKNSSELGKPVQVEFDGTGESVMTDIDGTKRILRNARGEIRRFYELHKVCNEALIYIVSLGAEKFKVTTHPAVEVLTTEPVTKRAESTISRVIRDTKVTIAVKEMYKNKCQVCGTSIKTKDGWYSEGAHIQGLGKPHNGPDIIENILCLCPNHHAMFDKGGFTINTDLSLNGIVGKLTICSDHKIGKEYIDYHRKPMGSCKPMGSPIS